VTQTYPSLGYCVLGDPDIPKQEELGLRLPGHHRVMPLDHRGLQVHAHFTQAATQTHGSHIHYSNLKHNSCMEWVDLGQSYIDFGLGVRVMFRVRIWVSVKQLYNIAFTPHHRLTAVGYIIM